MAILIFFVSIIFLADISILQVYPKEALVLTNQQGKQIRVLTEPGWVWIWQKLLPGYLQEKRIIFQNVATTYRFRFHLLNSGSQKETPDSQLSLYIALQYSFLKQHWLKSRLDDPQDVPARLKNALHQFLFRFCHAHYKGLANYEKLAVALADGSLQEIYPLIKKASLAEGIRIDSIRLLKFSLPDKELLSRFRRIHDKDSTEQKYLANLRGQLYSLEQVQKDTAYLNRLQKLSDFLKTNPHMIDFVFYDTLSKNTDQLILKPEAQLPPMKKNTTKYKKLRIVE